MWRRIWAYSLFLLSLLATPCAFGQAPTPKEILSRISAPTDALENLSVKTKWSEYSRGSLVATDNQWVAKDHFGRIRVRSLHGATQSRKKVTDETYNGEITIGYTEDPGLNRLGESHNAKTRDQGERYKVAIVNEGLGSDGRGPNAYRNPFYFINDWIVETLVKRLERGDSFTVEPVGEPDADYAIHFQLSPDESPFKTKHSVFIDSTKGWVIVRHERKSETGVLLALTTCEYVKGDGGEWLPKSGVWKAWDEPPPQEPADTEWRFEVQEIKYNDPDFDESVFDVSLEEDVYVVDNRYNVSYYVGAENAVTAGLETLSQKALADQDDLLKRLKIKPSDIAKGSNGLFSTRSLLVLINIVVVVVVALLVVFFRRRLHA